MKIIITEEKSEEMKEKLHKMKKMAAEILDCLEEEMEAGARSRRRYDEDDDREERGFRSRGRY